MEHIVEKIGMSRNITHPSFFFYFTEVATVITVCLFYKIKEEKNMIKTNHAKAPPGAFLYFYIFIMLNFIARYFF